jgi:hypothetical protein
VPAATGTATATDDCSGIKSITSSDTTTSGSCAGNYVIHRKLDGRGQLRQQERVHQDITVTDTHGPTISCPANVTVDCKASILPAATGTATASDDCSGIKSITSSDVATPGTGAGCYSIARTWTAEDNCGNQSTCVQDHHGQGRHGADDYLPANVTVDCKASTAPAATGTATATDDCSGIKSITSSDTTTSGSCAGNYVIHRTWTAEDNCGNKSECTQDITVTDTHGPTISCPANVTVDCKASTGRPPPARRRRRMIAAGSRASPPATTTTSGSCAATTSSTATGRPRTTAATQSECDTGHHRDRHARADDQLPGQCDGGLQSLDRPGRHRHGDGDG